MLIAIDRGGYWQMAYVIPKGHYEAVKAEGLQVLRAKIAELLPELGDRVGELRTWEDVRFLRVSVDRLRWWSRPGLLCIGDAAHAMSAARTEVETGLSPNWVGACPEGCRVISAAMAGSGRRLGSALSTPTIRPRGSSLMPSAQPCS